jgi:hypothetical protein
MESHIFPLALTLGESDTTFSRDFFYKTPNHLTDFIAAADKSLLKSLRLIQVEDVRAGHSLSLVMDDEKNKAIAFLQA